LIAGFVGLIAQFGTAIGFLTRLPVSRDSTRDAKAIAQSARWFPLVGGLLGGIYCGAFALLLRVFPTLLTAVIIVIIDAWITGAMHFDGLADTADGFGGGRTKEDVLRIMRDHAIGAYGAVAIGLTLALKIAAIAALAGFVDRRDAFPGLLLAPALGRWSAVALGSTQSYARPREDDSGSVGSPTRFMGRMELVFATVVALGIAALVSRWRGVAAMALVAAVVIVWGWWCRWRIGGVTGDTLGAGIEIAECVVLMWFVASR
jgi:adenosylcobinamide-GDP ribazoletransferase